MRHWKYNIQIRDILKNNDHSLSEAAKHLGSRLRTFYKKHIDWIEDDWEYTEVMEYFEEGDVESVEDFDSALSDFYDWCDSNDVWVVVERYQIA